MADDRKDRRSDNDNGKSESGEDDGMSGQPIGGNDNNTGSGTTLTEGADFPGQSGTHQTSAEETGSVGSGNEGFIGSRSEDRGALNDEEAAEE